MKKYLLIAIISIIAISCGKSDDSELYEMAKTELLEVLKSPSSAKFHPLEEGDLVISDSLFKRSSLEEMLPEIYTKYQYGKEEESRELGIKYEKMLKDSAYTDIAVLKLTYEAENSYGALLKNSKLMTFERINYSDGSGGKWNFKGMK